MYIQGKLFMVYFPWLYTYMADCDYYYFLFSSQRKLTLVKAERNMSFFFIVIIKIFFIICRFLPPPSSRFKLQLGLIRSFLSWVKKGSNLTCFTDQITYVTTMYVPYWCHLLSPILFSDLVAVFYWLCVFLWCCLFWLWRRRWFFQYTHITNTHYLS